MICILALIVFGILGIFSAKYREFAREAFKCVSLRVTLRKCESRFDEQMKDAKFDLAKTFDDRFVKKAAATIP